MRRARLGWEFLRFAYSLGRIIGRLEGQLGIAASIDAKFDGALAAAVPPPETVAERLPPSALGAARPETVAGGQRWA